MNKFTTILAGTTIAAGIAFASVAGAAPLRFGEGVVTGISRNSPNFYVDGTAYTAHRTMDLVDFSNGDVVDVTYEVVNGNRVAMALEFTDMRLVRGDLVD